MVLLFGRVTGNLRFAIYDLRIAKHAADFFEPRMRPKHKYIGQTQYKQ